MQSTETLILFIFRKVLLQINKSINFSRPIIKNAKPQYQFKGFGVFKPRSRFAYTVEFASFWLRYSILRA